MQQFGRMSWFTASVDVARIAGAVGVAITIWEGTKAWWADGPGRRKHWTNSYRKLACGVQAEYVESLFGVPPQAAPKKRTRAANLGSGRASAGELPRRAPAQATGSH